MTRRGWRVTLASGAWLLPIASPLVAQTEGTLNLGASVVEYEGFLSSRAVVFAPALRFDSPRLSLASQGSWTVFESGRGVIQGNAAAAWLAGSSGSWRLELSGAGGAASYDGDASGHLLAGARLHVFATNSGGWIGTNVGQSFGGPSGVPVEAVVAGWSVRNRLAMVGSATTTWQGRIRHLDLVGAIRWTGPRVELEARVGARPWAQDPDGGRTEAYGEITAVLPFGRWFAVSLGAGKFPSDPVRQIVGATYVNAGFRLRAFGRPARTVPVHTTSVLAGRRVPTEESGPPLELEGSAERRTLRVRATDATSVEVMGDFTDWLPVRLERVAPGMWEATLAVPAGIHRVNLRLNGGPWSAPGGARVERTEFGGVVGIVVVP